MNLFRWLPAVTAPPTFAFIAYWIWRHGKASGTGRLPRTPEELRQVDPQFKDEFTRASNRLRWFNLWLVLAIIAGAVIFSIFDRH